MSKNQRPDEPGYAKVVDGKPTSSTKVNDIPALAALRLAIVETAGEGMDLVSLALGVSICEGDGLAADGSIPRFVVGSDEEKAACELAGIEYDGGWPGWEVIIPYLIREGKEWPNR